MPSRRAQRRDGVRRPNREGLLAYLLDEYAQRMDAYWASKIRPVAPPAPVSDRNPSGSGPG